MCRTRKKKETHSEASIELSYYLKKLVIINSPKLKKDKGQERNQRKHAITTGARKVQENHMENSKTQGEVKKKTKKNAPARTLE